MRAPLILLALIAGCTALPAAPVARTPLPPLSGGLDTAWRTQARLSEWLPAQVTLSRLNGEQLASVTTLDGSFSLAPAGTFGQNEMGRVVARRQAAPALGLQTNVQWNGSRWLSVTNGATQPDLPLRVNLNTTAATLLAEAQGLAPSLTVGSGEQGQSPAYAGVPLGYPGIFKGLVAQDITSDRDPLTQTYWRVGTGMTNNRYSGYGGVIGENLYLVGGVEVNTNVTSIRTNLVEIFNLNTRSWSLGAPMALNRSHGASTIYQDKLYILGGAGDGNCASRFDCYDPQSNSWSSKLMPFIRNNCALAVLNGKFYAFGGGVSAPGMTAQTVSVYDPVADTWSTAPDYPIARSRITAVTVGNKIYGIGGNSTGDVQDAASTSVYAFDGAIWTQVASMNQRRANAGLCTDGTKVIVVGGWAGMWSVETYDPAANTWTVQPRAMSFPRYNGTICGLASGQLVVGGASCAYPSWIPFSP